MINRGELKLNIKKITIVFLIIIILIISGLVFKYYKYNQRENIKIPILLYHDFVLTVPDSDPDNFNYINTKESFEENIKTFLNNGYEIISMSDLASSDSGKIELPKKTTFNNF